MPGFACHGPSLCFKATLALPSGQTPRMSLQPVAKGGSTELQALPVPALTPDGARLWPPAPSGGGQTSSAAPMPLPRARRHRQAILSTLEPG